MTRLLAVTRLGRILKGLGISKLAPFFLVEALHPMPGASSSLARPASPATSLIRDFSLGNLERDSEDGTN